MLSTNSLELENLLQQKRSVFHKNYNCDYQKCKNPKFWSQTIERNSILIEEVKELKILSTTREGENTNRGAAEETSYPRRRERRAEEALKFKRETLDLNIGLFA